MYKRQVDDITADTADGSGLIVPSNPSLKSITYASTGDKFITAEGFEASSIFKTGGSASEFLKGNGTVDTSTYLTTVNDDNWSGTALAIRNGGTGAITEALARTGLGLAIGTDVQAYDAQLDDIAALAVTDGNFIVGNGTNWVAESAGTARTSLGLGTLATASSIDITANTNLAVTAPIVLTPGGVGEDDVLSISAASGSASGSMSSDDFTKLNNIEAGAEVNVPPDWNATTGDGVIANKPTVGVTSPYEATGAIAAGALSLIHI